MRYIKSISKWIYGHSLICLVIMVLIVFVPYIIVFANNGLSNQSQNWSYFGSYIGGTLGIVSVFLLYITYREQRRTNHTDHFEKVLAYYVERIAKLQEKHREIVQFLYKRLIGIFLRVDDNEKYDDLNKEQAKSVLKYTYSNIIMDKNQNNRSFEDVFDNIEYALTYIEDDTLIEGKSNYAKEIGSALTLESKVVLFFYLISNDKWDLLEVCDKYCFFRDWGMENDMFNYVASMFCKNSKPILKESESPNTDLYEINDNTTYYDVLDYLKQRNIVT